MKNIQIFLFLLIIIVVSEADVWKQAIMNNKGQRIMVLHPKKYIYIFFHAKEGKTFIMWWVPSQKKQEYWITE